MFKAMPSFNKIIAKKWEEQNLKAHEERVKDAKSGIRILDPVVYGCGKSKKQQIEDEKWMKINRENGILHGKLDLIEKKLLQTPKISKSVSLNKVFIKEQQRLIVAANAQMQNRIEKASSSYSLNKLLKDRERTEKTLKNLCEFPYTLGKHHTSTPKISTSSSVISLFEKKVAVSGKNFIARVQKSNK